MVKKKSSPRRSDDGCNVALLNEYRSFILQFVPLIFKPLHFCISFLDMRSATSTVLDMLF